MTFQWRVDSYHINIGVGDGAIHILAKEYSKTKTDLIKAVWIDGGKGHSTPQAQLDSAIYDIPDRYTNTSGKYLVFDVIVFSHWDHDHYGGLKEFLGDSTAFGPHVRDANDPMPTRIVCASVLAKGDFKWIKSYTTDTDTMNIAGIDMEVYYGEDLIGADLFLDTAPAGVGTQHQTLNNLDDLIALRPAAGKPVQPRMYIIAIDQVVIGPQNRSFDTANALWYDRSTDTNRSSIGNIIAWPDTKRVSHYFAGDMNWYEECEIADWLKHTVDNYGRIPSMKASHHGSCSSSPTMLIDTFQPNNIVISAANAHNHPDWETIAYVSHYVETRSSTTSPPHRGPFIFTRYPYWLYGDTDPDQYRYKDTVLSSAWMGQTSGIAAERREMIENFVHIMESNKVIIWAQLMQKYNQKGGPRTPIQIFVELTNLFVASNQALFAELKQLSDGEIVEWVRVTSYSAETDGTGSELDGLVHYKFAGDSEYVVKPKIVVPAKPKAPKSKKNTGPGKVAVAIQKVSTRASRVKARNAQRQKILKLAAKGLISTTMSFALDETKLEAFAGTVSPELRVASLNTTAATPEFKFTLWASDTDSTVQALSSAGRVLNEGEPLNYFTHYLRSWAIQLVAAPTAEGVAFDVDDDVFEWMQLVLKATGMTMKGSATAITSILMNAAKGLVFDTASAADMLSTSALGTKIKNPGLIAGTDHTMMVFGLISSTLKTWKLADIYSLLSDLTKLDGASKAPVIDLHDLAKQIDTTAWTLSTQKGARNALWFAPAMNYQTNLRLEFGLDSNSTKSGPLSLLKKFWPQSVGLTIDQIKLICNYDCSTATRTDKNMTVTTDLGITLYAELTATVKEIIVKIKVAVTLTVSGSISLTVQSADSKSDFVGFIQAVVADLFDSSEKQSTNFDSIIPSEVKDKLHFRQLKLTFEDGKIQYAGLMVEVEAKLGRGKGSKQENIAIRLSTGYQRGLAGGGLFLAGQLWFYADADDDLPYTLLYDYEPLLELKPWTPNAAPMLSLPDLLPDSVDVSNLPTNIPRYVTEASFLLTPKGIRVSGMIESCAAYAPHGSDLPQLDFAELDVSAEFQWSPRAIKLSLEFRIELNAPDSEVAPKTTSVNQLIGSFNYDSAAKSWQMSASIQELELGLLYQYFSPDSQDLLYDILKEIRINELTVSYSSHAGVGIFEAIGDFAISDAVSTKLTFRRESSGAWNFSARISPDDKVVEKVTLGQLAASVFGAKHDLVTGFPDFLADIPILGPGTDKPYLKLTVDKLKDENPVPDPNSTVADTGVRFVLEAGITNLSVVFVQLHRTSRRSTPNQPAPGPIRYFRLSLKNLKIPGDPPLLSNFKAPFDELGFLYVNSELTSIEVASVNSALKQDDTSSSGGQDSPSAPDAKAVGMAQGFHFVVLSDGASVIDYPIGKARTKPRQVDSGAGPANKSGSAPAPPVKQQPPSSAVDARSPKTPLKKSRGPLTINSLQLQYKNEVLSVQMDAIFTIGPLMFALLGFEIGMDLSGGVTLQSLDIKNVHISIDGLAASFKRPPLTIEGGLIHRKDKDTDIYAGGITIGFVPWLFEAAGFYGKKRKKADSNEWFTSALVYAILRGPLITLEFATISGITGGFGYNVGINLPKVADIYKFPFTKSPTSDDTDIVTTLNSMLKETPDQPQWFFPQDDAMWLAAGLTVSAFEMLDVTAVLVAQWSPQLQFHIVGLASADIPNAKSPFKLAHVELGFIASLDVDIGFFSVEAQLTPNSYILDPSCHLSGGFALFYWFKNGSGVSQGDFVFTIGGYHSAFQVPAHYPKPPRLAISWALGDSLAIRGEAYFAITPKACMAGMHIKATLTLGPLRAWFDAYADFLINYAPFKFTATGGLAIGVSYNMDIWFVHIHISVEISATLYLYGPPIAGIVHVDFWVFGFDIEFGDRSKLPDSNGLSLEKFFALALAADSKTQAQSNTKSTEKPHVYTCFGGLISSSASAEVKEGAPWEVRGGPFVFGVNAYFAIQNAIVNGDDRKGKVPLPTDGRKDRMYAKPMRLREELTSDLRITITDPKGLKVAGWRLSPIMKSVPSALWGFYEPGKDPVAGAGNNIGDLLSADPGSVRLMMGVELKAPEATIANEKLLPFDIEKAMIEDVTPVRQPWPRIPIGQPQDERWAPAEPLPTPPEPEPEVKPKPSGAAAKPKPTSSVAAAKPPPPVSTQTHNQWTVVRDTWKKADATATVSNWVKIMGWKPSATDKPADKPNDNIATGDVPAKDKPAVDKPVIISDRPDYMIERIPSLFLQAPHLCV